MRSGAALVEFSDHPKFYRIIFWLVALNALSRGHGRRDGAGVHLAVGVGRGVLVGGPAAIHAFFAPELNLFQHLPITDGEIFQYNGGSFSGRRCGPSSISPCSMGRWRIGWAPGWQAPVIGLCSAVCKVSSTSASLRVCWDLASGSGCRSARCCATSAPSGCCSLAAACRTWCGG